jgi:hypothetical protein
MNGVSALALMGFLVFDPERTSDQSDRDEGLHFSQGDFETIM